MHDGAWLWIYTGSGGETRLKMCGAEAILWKILNHTAHMEKILIDIFPRLTAVLTIYMALPITRCEVKRNIKTIYRRKENLKYPFRFLQKMILQNLCHMKR